MAAALHVGYPTDAVCEVRRDSSMSKYREGTVSAVGLATNEDRGGAA